VDATPGHALCPATQGPRKATAGRRHSKTPRQWDEYSEALGPALAGPNAAGGPALLPPRDHKWVFATGTHSCAARCAGPAFRARAAWVAVLSLAGSRAGARKGVFRRVWWQWDACTVLVSQQRDRQIGRTFEDLVRTGLGRPVGQGYARGDHNRFVSRSTWVLQRSPVSRQTERLRFTWSSYLISTTQHPPPVSGRESGPGHAAVLERILLRTSSGKDCPPLARPGGYKDLSISRHRMPQIANAHSFIAEMKPTSRPPRATITNQDTQLTEPNIIRRIGEIVPRHFAKADIHQG
jgi:hypothetical protein